VCYLRTSTNVAVGFPLQLTGLIEGRATDSVWNLGWFIAINEPFTAYAWDAPGDYLVACGPSTTASEWGPRDRDIHVITGIHYVAANNTTQRRLYFLGHGRHQYTGRH